MKRYHLTCRCSQTVDVGPGQAGGVVVCPDCGVELAVPRLRDLDRFAVASSSPPARASRPGLPLLLAGAAVAVAAALTAIGVGRYGAAVVDRLPDEATIRAGVSRADTETIYEVWKMMLQAGVNRGPLPDELHAQQTVASTDRIAGALWVVAAAGAVVALAGMVRGWLAGGRPATPVR